MPAETVAIVGSLNTDLVVPVPHVPAPGETVLGRDVSTIPGGKGGNQAVAAARQGGRALMVGRVGDDDFGRQLIAGLRASGVDCAGVSVTPGVASGMAMIVVDASGENAITVISGANFRVTPADIDAAEPLLRLARVCLLQLELPIETVVHAIRLCRRHGIEAILDPAPAPAGQVPPELFEADIVSPNETEAAALTGLAADSPPEKVAAALHARGTRGVVLKRGRRGAYVSSAGQRVPVPAFAVDVVDSTAAGDAFTAALGVARAAGLPLGEAARFACAAGALACTKWGAQPSMPTRQETEALIAALLGNVDWCKHK